MTGQTRNVTFVSLRIPLLFYFIVSLALVQFLLLVVQRSRWRSAPNWPSAVRAFECFGFETATTGLKGKQDKQVRRVPSRVSLAPSCQCSSCRVEDWKLSWHVMLGAAPGPIHELLLQYMFSHVFLFYPVLFSTCWIHFANGSRRLSLQERMQHTMQWWCTAMMKDDGRWWKMMKHDERLRDLVNQIMKYDGTWWKIMRCLYYDPW